MMLNNDVKLSPYAMTAPGISALVRYIITIDIAICGRNGTRLDYGT